MGKEGEGSSRNMYKGPTDKAKGGKDGEWGVGGWGRGKWWWEIGDNYILTLIQK